MPLVLTSCLNPCGNEVKADVPSPGGKEHAVVFERDCAATTRFSFQVSILNRDDQVKNDGGNAFVADSNHGAVQSMYVRVRWLTPDRVVVSYPGDARLFRHEHHVNGTATSYEPDRKP